MIVLQLTQILLITAVFIRTSLNLIKHQDILRQAAEVIVIICLIQIQCYIVDNTTGVITFQIFQLLYLLNVYSVQQSTLQMYHELPIDWLISELQYIKTYLITKIVINSFKFIIVKLMQSTDQISDERQSNLTQSLLDISHFIEDQTNNKKTDKSTINQHNILDNTLDLDSQQYVHQQQVQQQQHVLCATPQKQNEFVQMSYESFVQDLDSPLINRKQNDELTVERANSVVSMKKMVELLNSERKSMDVTKPPIQPTIVQQPAITKAPGWVDNQNVQDLFAKLRESKGKLKQIQSRNNNI